MDLMLRLVLCGFFPGFLLVRRLPLGPASRLLCAVGASLLLVHLVTFAAYALGWPFVGTVWAYTGVAAICAALTWRDAAAFVRAPEIAEILRCWAAALGVLLLWQCLPSTYDGAGFATDWIAHFERARVFAAQSSPLDLVLGRDPLPSRPPLMNTVVAFLMGREQPPFYLFQIASAVLNALPFFAVCALVARFSGGRRLPYAVVGFLLVACPMFVFETSYTWTKLLTAFFVLSGLYHYVLAWRDGGGTTPMVAAWAFLAAACLVHFSAGPYVVVLCLHYLLAVWPRRRARWQELALVAGVSAVILGSWFGWSVAVFGPELTFGSNTTVVDGAKYTLAQRLAMYAGNVQNTLLPHFVRGNGFRYLERGTFEDLAAFSHLLYQRNLLFILGTSGVVLLVALARRGRDGWEALGPAAFRRWLWLWFMPPAAVLGIIVVSEPDRYGLAHICLLSLGLFVLALILARAPDLTRGWWRAAFAVALLDVGLVLVPNYAVLARGSHDAGLVFLADLVRPVQPAVWVAVLAATLAYAFTASRELQRGQKQAL